MSLIVDGAQPPVIIDRNGCLYPVLSLDSRYIAAVVERQDDFAYDISIIDQASHHYRTLDVSRYSPINVFPHFTPDGKNILFLAGPPNIKGWTLASVSISTGTVSEKASFGLFDTPLKWHQSQ